MYAFIFLDQVTGVYTGTGESMTIRHVKILVQKIYLFCQRLCPGLRHPDHRHRDHQNVPLWQLLLWWQVGGGPRKVDGGIKTSQKCNNYDDYDDDDDNEGEDEDVEDIEDEEEKEKDEDENED